MEHLQKQKYYEDRKKQQQAYELKKRNSDKLKLSKQDGKGNIKFKILKFN
jgi:hypothetical protein